METEQQVLSARFSAPSKIILSGEHAVVYGHPAIAFAVGQSWEDHEEGKEIDENIAYRTQCSIIVSHKTGSERPFLKCKWRIITNLGKSTIFETTYNDYADLSNLEERKDLEKLGAQIFLEAVKKGCDDNQDIINEIVSKYTFDVTFGFGVPIGAGLGSSGSFNWVATGSIYMIFKALIQKELPSEITVTREDLEVVKDLTHFGEKLVHGNPSGIDSYIISEGGIVKFTKTDGEISWENDFDIPADLNFDIVFTGVNRSTKTSLVNMLNLKNAFPEVFGSLLGSIATVTGEFEKMLKSGTFDVKNALYLTNVNHKLLQSLQLSVPIIDELTMAAEEYKVGLKITGAGCGGCLLIIYSEDSDIAGFHKKLEDYKERGVRLIKAEKSDKGFAVDSFTLS